MPPVPLRPRSVTEIIDASVSLLRQHYLELVTATALFTIPWLIIQLLQRNALAANFQTAPTALFAARPSGSLLLAILVSALILGPLASATTVVIVADNYLGREVTIANALARAFSRIVPVAITGILQGIAIAIGFVLLFIPGFFCIAWFFSAVNVIMVEGKGPTDAMGRARFLAKGSVGRILGALFLSFLLVWVVSLVIQFALTGILSAVHVGAGLATVIGQLGSVFVYPLVTVVTTVLYFDLRIRKEGLDLELMAKELGVSSGNPVPA